MGDEYLFILLTENVNDETRCTEGDKPKTVIIPKRLRHGNIESGKMFLTYANLPDMYKITTYATVGSYTPFYLHDCQGRKDCPGCHSEKHVPETKTVDGRDCDDRVSKKRAKAKARKSLAK